MASSQDTEITLGTAKLLGIFFGLVMICAVFFALGYALGRKSETSLTSAATLGGLPASNAAKPATSGAASSTPMTFYKAVEQQSANPQPSTTPAAGGDAGAQQSTASSPSTTSSGDAASTAGPPDPMAPVPASGYFVQVAAVSKQDDADALVDALKKKQYPAFVANTSGSDKLFRVQLGPFGDIKEAEAMRSRLINDGYNPILKK
jgi:DedD protein